MITPLLGKDVWILCLLIHPQKERIEERRAKARDEEDRRDRLQPQKVRQRERKTAWNATLNKGAQHCPPVFMTGMAHTAQHMSVNVTTETAK